MAEDYFNLPAYLHRDASNGFYAIHKTCPNPECPDPFAMKTACTTIMHFPKTRLHLCHACKEIAEKWWYGPETIVGKDYKENGPDVVPKSISSKFSIQNLLGWVTDLAEEAFADSLFDSQLSLCCSRPHEQCQCAYGPLIPADIIECVAMYYDFIIDLYEIMNNLDAMKSIDPSCFNCQHFSRYSSCPALTTKIETILTSGIHDVGYGDPITVCDKWSMSNVDRLFEFQDSTSSSMEIPT